MASKQGPEELQEKKIQMLEEKVLRLTRTVLDLQSSIAGVNENLKHAVQDDASKPTSGLGPHAQPGPGSEVARDPETAQPPGVLNSKESGMKDIQSELAEVRDTLRTKSDKLEELDGKVEQLKQLQEAAQGPTVTMTTGELYQAYVDSKVEALREELLEGMDRKLADLKRSCEYQLAGLQQPCDDDGAGYLGLVELLGEKEASLRKDLDDLRARLQRPPAPPGCCGDLGPQLQTLEQKIERVAEATRMLNGRLDNELDRLVAPEPEVDFDARWSELDARINVSERNAEEHCFYVEETLRGAIAGQVGDLRRLLDRRLHALEDRLLQVANDTAGDVAPPGAALPGLPGTGGEQVLAELNHLRDRVHVVEDICLQNLQGGPAGLEGTVPTREDPAVGDGLSLVESLNDTMHRKFQEAELDIQKLREDLSRLHSQLNRTEGDVTGLQKAMGPCRAGTKAAAGGCTKGGEQERTVETLPPPQDPEAQCCGQLEDRWQRLQSQLLSELDTCQENMHGVQRGVSEVEDRVSRMERTCSKLDSMSGSLQTIKEGLGRHVSSLWNCVRQMNGTLRSHSRDISGLKNSVQQFYSHVFQISTDLQDLIKFQPSASKLTWTVPFLACICRAFRVVCGVN